MRIFTAVRHANDPVQFYGGLWSANFYPALRALSHEVVESQTDLLPLSRFMTVADGFTPQELEARARVTEQIVDEVRIAHRKAPIHLFLSYFYNAHFDPAGFGALRALGIPTVNFYCNSIYQFGLVAAIASDVDVSWHAERDARPSYLAVGANPVWVQMGADAQVYRPQAGVPRAATACFVGQRYADRARWVTALLRAGVPLDIYGPGWGAPTGVNGANSTDGGRTEYLGRAAYPAGSLRSYAAAVRETLAEQGVVGGVQRIARQMRYRREARATISRVSASARGAIPFHEVSGVFARSAVCLNFSNVWADGRPGSALVPHVRLRDFEAPMSRSCYLTGHTDEITQFYDIGKEIDTYRSEPELIDKTRFYLAHEPAADRMRAAGYARAVRDHTWTRRFEQLLSTLKITY